MRPVLELHLAGQTTADIQVALSAHLPTCAECIGVAQAYAQGGPPPPAGAPPGAAPGYGAEPSHGAAPGQGADPGYAATADPSGYGADGGYAGYPDQGYSSPPYADPHAAAPTVAELEAMARAAHEARSQPLAPTAIEGAEAAYMSEAELAAQVAAAAGSASPPVAPPSPPTDPDGDSVLPGPVRTIIDVIMWGSFVGVVALAVLVVPDVFEPPQPSTSSRVAVGVKVSDVRMARRRPNGSIELLTGNTIAPTDRLVFSYLHTASWERLLIVVTDEHNEIYWQFPDWTDRREPAYAPTILVDRHVQVIPVATHRDWEGKLLTVRWIFTRDFLTTRQVEERLLDPERDTTKPLFPDTLERQQLIAVDPTAADVAGVPQIDPDESGTSKIDSYLRISPNR